MPIANDSARELLQPLRNKDPSIIKLTLVVGWRSSMAQKRRGGNSLPDSETDQWHYVDGESPAHYGADPAVLAIFEPASAAAGCEPATPWAKEKLQRLNAELKTVKEELQSTNGELITVNAELQAKNVTIAAAGDFALSILEAVRQPLLVLDPDLRVKMANRAFYRTFQALPQEVQGRLIYSLSRGSWDLPGLRKALDGLAVGGRAIPEFEVDQDFPMVGRKTLMLGGCRINHLSMILLAVDDITERKLAQHAQHKSEEHPQKSQKMEAVGRLAGGVSHDFNNLLTIILGYSGLLLDTLAGNESAIRSVLEIKAAGERAASLTKQLLAFSRGQVLQPKVLDLNLIVADVDRMLCGLTGERIQVAIHCEPALWNVRADPGELGSAIMNLAQNARDSMPDGGAMTIKTANFTVSESAAHSLDLAPGRYATIAVRDTGIGMSEDLRSHVFEPFFTTKEMGKGTGLGLATVLGIVEQSGGAIRCQSEPGWGTVFTIFLPATTELTDHVAPRSEGLNMPPKGSEVILLVEDEDLVRSLARRVLERSGYVVQEASNGREGLALCEALEGPIDLLFTDVVMPEMGGRELAQGALKLRPELKLLFSSGHTHDVVLKEGIEHGMAFLPKPYTPAELAQKVRATLDSNSRSAVRLA